MEKVTADELSNDKATHQNSYIVTLGKKPNSKLPGKVYKVNVIYIQTSEEQARLKRSIIEGIIKKTFMK
ncbi:hypothetical protein [Pedobacter paludis]|uniref:Uncharacterized protein n=1 Tax=Pedobacter paludis TaxID=2203212 RepID=A0A317F212_9SPHI|nr:hypothetical protein [Pedobacter paludis]PWS32682.1 hypothetical protein DF947_06315 [Pedobacter paludis]